MAGNDEQQSQDKATQVNVSEIAKTARLMESGIASATRGAADFLQSPAFNQVQQDLELINKGMTVTGRELLGRGGMLSLDAGSVRAGAGTLPTTLNVTSSVEVAQLSSRLTKLEQGLNELKETRVDDNKVDEPLLNDLIVTAAEARGQTDNMLMARLHLPPAGLTEQYLVPSTFLERLEEYRSDENIYFSFAGIFGGAVLGVIGSWFVAEDLSITKLSVLFLLVLVIVTALFGYRAYELRKRSVSMKQKMFGDLRVPNQADAAGVEEASK